MTHNVANSLASSLIDRNLLSHPFYLRWETGDVSLDELQHYAEQYRHFEEMLPEFLRRLADELPVGVARDSVLKNLADEIAAPSHLDLFQGFASFYGAADQPMTPAMHHLVNAYFELLTEGPAAALAGLWAYESQGAGIADSKAEGLATFYGADRVALAFWLAHGSIEGDHAAWTLEALESLESDEDVVRRATRVIADAWWAFLDERELLSQ
jgi:pyrroloquinoline quinone (PQQ) biosynthesis protein C